MSVLSLVLGFLGILGLGVTFSQDPQNFRFRFGRLILDFAEFGSANVNLDAYGLGGVDFNGYTRGSSGQISFYHPFGQGKGTFSIYAWVDGWEVSEGFASLDASMNLTFRFIFDIPEDMPQEVSLPGSVGFVSFVEGRANAWAHGPLPSDSPGSASASGNFNTELVSASASISAFFPNPPYFPFDVYDYDPEPEQGYRRDAAIKSVDIATGQGDWTMNFSGSASTSNFNAMSVGSAYARTGIVVLSGIPQSLNPDYYPLIDPLGVPEVGDNEYVFHPILNQLIIPAGARICAGFIPSDGLLQWLAEKFSWELSPSLPVPNPEYSLPNGYEGSLIFPRTLDIYGTQWRGLVFWTGQYLPATNGGFGRRQVIMKFDGNFVHAANVEIFFPATAYNHPFFGDTGTGNPPDEGWQFIGNTAVFVITSPNWFYYYWMAAYFNDFRIRYADSDYSFYYNGDRYVHIGNDVINGHIEAADGIRRWETYIPEQPYNETCPVVAYQVYGIDAYVRAVAHELEHKRIYDDYHALIEQAAQDGVTLDDPNDDYDGDDLPNFVEEQVGTNPERRSTIGLFDDDELLANLAEHNVFGDRDADWSDRGLNKGAPRQRVLTRVVR